MSAAAPTSAVRPMVTDSPTWSDRGMDEPTLDCLLCGHDAVFEVRLENLNDSAEWRTSNNWPTCEKHLNLYEINVRHLLGHQRLVLMRCR